MPTLSSLSRVDMIRDTDEVILYSPSQGDTRKASMPQVAAYVQAKTEGDPDETIYSVVSSGGALTVAALPVVAGAGVWVQLNPASNVPSITIALPGVGDRAQDQEVLVTSTKTLASIAINGNGAVVRGAPTTLSADGFFTLRFDSLSTTWYRVG